MVSKKEIKIAIKKAYDNFKEEDKSIAAIFASQLIFHLNLKEKGKIYDEYYWKRDDTHDMYID
jgi:hypothetical protein